MRFWVRCLRQLVVSLPLIGLYGIPLWRWIVEIRPRWAIQETGPAGPDLEAPGGVSRPLSSPLAWFHALRRKQGQTVFGLTFLLLAGQIAPWVALISWLTAAEGWSPARRALLLAMNAAFHVLACACGLQYGFMRSRQVHAGRWKAAAMRFTPILFLTPFPYFVIGWLLWMVLAGEERETLTGRSHSHKTQRPLPLSLGPGSSLGNLIRFLMHGKKEIDVILNDLLPGTLVNSELKNHQLAFYRIKSFLLLFDAAALAWAFTRLGGRPLLRIDIFPWLQISPFLGLAALGVVVELGFLGLRILGWALRRGLPYQPYGRSITVTQMSLMVGLLFGTLLAVGQAPTAGHLLLATGLAAIIGSALIYSPLSFLLRLPGRQLTLTIAWIALFFEIFLTSAVMYLQPELAPPFVTFFQSILALTPIWSLALFLGLSGWLLHPFELGHILDRRLPGKVRALLAAVALTAALPLGGIAISFWVYAHHRLWPRYEKLLWNLRATSPARV